MFQRHSSRRAGAVRCISARCAQPRPPPSDFLLGSQSVPQQVPLAPPSPLRTRLPTQDLAPSSTGSHGDRPATPSRPPCQSTPCHDLRIRCGHMASRGHCKSHCFTGADSWSRPHLFSSLLRICLGGSTSSEPVLVAAFLWLHRRKASTQPPALRST